MSRRFVLILLVVAGLVLALSNAGEPASAQTFGCAGSTAVPDSTNTGLVADCEALLGMKNALGGSGLNWSASLLISDWTGVTTTAVPERVTQLDLTGMSLTGTIPADLEDLDSLTHLSLAENQYTGGIPAELGNLTLLQDLRLNDNSLSGSIPTELGDLSNLETLHLYRNQLSGSIPASLGGLSKLLQLVIFSNQLTGGIPSQLTSLTSLTHLNLGPNPLGGTLPSNIGDMTSLQFIRLNDSQLTGSIPTSFGSLSQLQQLRLNNNSLTGSIPTGLGSLTNLTILHLQANQLSGSIPALGNLTNLEELRLNNNSLTGSIPAGLGSLTNLTHLHLHFNQLSGSIPTALGSLTNLEELHLFTNSLTGGVPAAITSLTNLTHLNLSQNALGGTLPSNIGSMTALQVLAIHDAQLTGSIPTSVGSLSNLTELRLNHNSLSGGVPAEVANLTNLLHLNLSANPLGGGLPSNLGSLTQLQVLAIHDAQLTGAIPSLSGLTQLRELRLNHNRPGGTTGLTGSIPALAHMTGLEQLHLQHNSLTGPIPSLAGLTRMREIRLNENKTDTNTGLTGSIPALAHMTGLEHLHLHVNSLSGSIPSLSGLAGLRELRLNNNRTDSVSTGFTGSIPSVAHMHDLRIMKLEYNALTGSIPSLTNQTRLTELRVDNNMLTGPIPSAIGNMAGLGWLDLSVNQLTGGIPASIGNLGNLRGLFLYDNMLTGPIPGEFGGLTSLEWLWLWNNELSGNIPPQLGGLPSLKYMSLGTNMLEGPIPTELGNLPRLEWLYLGSNRLNGTVPASLGNLSTLTVLRFEDNQLVGELPPELGNLSNLADLWVWGNSFTGPIPPWLSSLTGMVRVSLWGNQFSGPIPTQLGSLTNLQTLYLGDNLLTGSIPTQIGDLPNLQYLDLSDNLLTGTIPSNLTNLAELYLAGNRYSGCSPAVLRSAADHDLALLSIPHCDVVLSSLSVSSTSLSPAFDQYVYEYRVPVSGTAFTVNAANAHSATIEFLDASDTVVDDDDALTSGHQVTFAGDASTFTVKVTSSDGMAMWGYVLQVNATVAPVTTAVAGRDFVDVTWTAPPTTSIPAVTSYDLRYREAEGGEWTVLDSVWTTGSGSLAHRLADLSPGVEYDVQVRAFNGAYSAWSATASATPTANSVPRFNEGETATRQVLETQSSRRLIGLPVAATDQDDANLTYSLGGPDSGFFEIESDTGQLRNRNPLDYETRSSYSVTVSVTDGKDIDHIPDGVIDDTIRVTINVTDVNEPPVVEGRRFTNYPENGTGPIATYTATDPEGEPVTLTLGGSDPSAFEVTPDGVLRFAMPPDHENPGDRGADNTYDVVVLADDGATTPGRIPIEVFVYDVQEAPELSGDTAITVDERATCLGSTYTASDDDGAPPSGFEYTLTGADAGAFELGAGEELCFRTASDFEQPLDANRDNEYHVTVNVSDGALTGSLSVVVTVSNEDEAGTVQLSHLQPQVGTSFRATLDDPDGRVTGVTWQWSRSSSRSARGTAIAGATSAMYTPDAADENSYLRATATYSDGEGAGKEAFEASSEEVVPGPANNSPPGFASTSIERTIRENTVAGDDVGGPVTATDVDGDILVYTIDRASEAFFAIDRQTGQLTTRVALDYEVRSRYSVTVTATDPSGAIGRTTVTVNVTDVNEAPVVSGPTSVEFAENGTAGVGRFTAHDPDGEPVEWQPLGGADAGLFQLSDSGVLSFQSPPDFEGPGDNEYEVTVLASDSQITGGLAVTVEVTDVNEPPVISPSNEMLEVDENTDVIIGRYVASDPEGADAHLILAGADADDFTLSASGELRFRAEPDYESPADANRDNVYSVSVDAFDGTHTASHPVEVTVANVDEAGAVGLSTLQPQEGSRVTATLTEPDVVVGAVSWRWESSSSRFGGWAVIDGATSSTYTPVAGDVNDFLRVTASYNDQAAVGQSEAAVSEERVRAQPTQPNRAPAFPASERGERSVAENTAAGVAIGVPLSAEDADSDPLTYSLDSAGEAVFNIDPETGQLRTEAPLDREARNSHTFTVTATDPSLARATVRVTVDIEDENEEPVLSGPSVVGIPENHAGTVATYTADDPERAPVAWTLSGRDGGAFEIGNGALRFLRPPDFESPANGDGENTYEVTVEATAAGDTVTREVVVIVRDVAEGQSRSPGGGGSGFGGGLPAGGGGGGSGPSGPTPSTVDFEWTVKHDLEALDGGNDAPTGIWSDGTTLWIADNPDGAGDAIYAYDLETGERVEGLEFKLSERNRAPRGIWADRTTMWVSDSGRERLFAYDLATGEPLEDRDIVLAERNADARDFWSDGQTMWVLDGIKDSLFAYDLTTGDLLAEYPLDSRNNDPQGIWSDGVTIWVSDAGASPRSLFAYRLPVPPDEQGEGEENPELERVRDEDFTELSQASNNSPRGIWSDGAVMYVADESDGKVYTYNMPDAIDARLAALALSGIDIGEFDPGTTEYDGVIAEDVTETVVVAEAMQRRTDIAIDPPDADGDDTNGHRVSLPGVSEITVTVTSADGSRERVYRVRLEAPEVSVALEAGWNSLAWPGAEGISVSQALQTAGLADNVVAVYRWDEEAGRWLGYFPSLDAIPGLNTLTALGTGQMYWVAIEEAATWSIPVPAGDSETAHRKVP